MMETLFGTRVSVMEALLDTRVSVMMLYLIRE